MYNYYVASQSAFNSVSTHNKKISTTSFGGSMSTNEGCSETILEKSRDKSETLGMSL